MQDIQDLSAVLRSNTPIVVIETYEEYRVIELLRKVSKHPISTLVQLERDSGADASR